MFNKLVCSILLVSMLAISAPAQVKVVVFSDDFETPHDYVANNVAGTGWDGYYGWLPGETVDALNASMERPGQLYVASTGGVWSGPWDPLGPFIFKMVEGDFIATVEVSDYSNVFHNNCGLMARAYLEADRDDAGPGEDWVSLDYFPIWGCGNFVRTANNNGRDENGHNGKAFDLDPWLQLERKGNTFHFRTSPDGITWTEMLASPVTRDDFEGLTLQVGLHHATFSGTQGYASFDNFVIEKTVQLKAYEPVPADGAPDVTEATLQWQAGETAAWHDIYFGTDPDNLELLARNTLEQTTYAYDQEVAAGITYYWRIDEVEADEATIHQGDVWSFQVLPMTAWNPGPPDGGQCVLPDADLSWTEGSTAESHEVYFGTDESAVANATTDSPEFKGNQSQTTFEPGTLLNDTTYFWRIDEVEADGSTKHPGQVWSFTTIVEIPISDPALVGWWKLEGSCAETLVVDSSGYNRHGALMGDPQKIIGFDGNALEFDGRGDYVELPIGPVIGSLTSSTFMVWMDSLPGGSWVRAFDFHIDEDVYMCLGPRWWFMDDMYFAITEDGADNQVVVQTTGFDLPTGWHHVAVTIDTTNATMILYYDGEEVGNATAMLTPSDLGETTNNWLGRSHDADNSDYLGAMDDFRIYNYALSPADIARAMKGDPMLAWNPSPANGSTPDVDRATPLSWALGDNATQHVVYFGTDAEAVEQADASDTTNIYRGQQDPNSYTPPEELEWGQTYYWRVDEVAADATVSKGRIWSFTLAEYRIIDDFESYNDITSGEPGSNLVYETWIDGYLNPTTNGATMGYVSGASMEFEIVLTGNQSVPLSYNNTTASYSEVAVDTSSLPVGSDWTGGDVQVLTLWFYGEPANAVTEQMYVKLNGVKVNYDGDAANLATEDWTQWDINLSEFGIDLAGVNELAIGLERIGASRGSGRLFIDDVRLYIVAP